MNGNSLTIQNPFGISVFGSALVRVSPDSATITAAVTRLEKKPPEAFAGARQSAHAITEFLRRAHVLEFGLSRISVSQEYRMIDSERRPVGYNAKIGLTVILNKLDEIEEIISGLVDAGANEITSIEFHTSKLKELRIETRRLATQAAREKAETYAAAANVSLGGVVHIQDVNPKLLQQMWVSQFHVGGTRPPVQREMVDREPEEPALDPGAIEVGAAVLVAYRIVG